MSIFPHIQQQRKTLQFISDKPTLSKEGWRWACRGKMNCQWGDTPFIAYELWKFSIAQKESIGRGEPFMLTNYPPR